MITDRAKHIVIKVVLANSHMLLLLSFAKHHDTNFWTAKKTWQVDMMNLKKGKQKQDPGATTLRWNLMDALEKWNRQGCINPKVSENRPGTSQGNQGFSSVQSLIRVLLFATPWTAARQTSLSITNSQSPPKPMSIELVMPSKHLIFYHPLLLLPSIFPSIRVFSNESALHIRWPKYWSFSFNINPTNEHPGLISFRMDWLNLLAVQGTLKSLLQYHSSKASILLHSAFFIVQLSHPYMTTGKTIALTRWTCVDKVMSLIFNMLYVGHNFPSKE